MTGPVRYALEGDVALVITDNPPVNALGFAVREGLQATLEQAIADDGAKAVVLVCEGRTFFAGADISEFGKPPRHPILREVHEVIENCPKPVVAALHGTALGGGFETALACHYRVAVPSAKVGLPEVKLGIIPGAGGTQRLPRLVGVEKAIQMICNGNPIGAAEAHELGLVDRIADGDLTQTAVTFAREVVAKGATLVRVRDREAPGGADPARFEAAREEFARKRRGFLAPQHCIAAVEAAATLDFDAGMKRERELFTELVTSDQSAAQRHLFFAERHANKIPDIPRDTPTRDIAQVSVIGAGTMGGGIAMSFANAGIPVVILETGQEALDRGMGVIRKNYEGSAKRGRITTEDAENRIGLIRPSLDITDISDSDLIIEAVFENMDLKKQIFRRIDNHAKPGAILATNTSTLDVNEIARATARPPSVLGLHFFSPANVMRLLEVVRGDATDKSVIATAMAMTKKIGKVPVLAGVCHGFIGNRMLHAYFDQAFRLLYEGCQPQDVDRAIYDFGFAMGPFAMSDLAGLDVSWRVRQEKGQTQPIADRLCELGRFGQKTGAGYYRYAEGSRTPEPDPEVAAIVEEEGLKRHGSRREIGTDEIVERCMLALVNEGARILEEGIALRASDIDVTYVFGYSFPAYRGGPMFWADLMGLPAALKKIEDFKLAGHGDVWTPAPLIEALVAEGRSFADFDKAKV
ncbi:MAG: 3-hydroxyacyl-CoA dehydrogenase NAD-binding domain-containing protein [Paracoccaceae bacterium]|nr:3-hydroxyacyl-CoA dehydrogenase NAD-binding domain-containing protein [Paracoccaceae bacterium]